MVSKKERDKERTLKARQTRLSNLEQQRSLVQSTIYGLGAHLAGSEVSIPCSLCLSCCSFSLWSLVLTPLQREVEPLGEGDGVDNGDDDPEPDSVPDREASVEDDLESLDLGAPAPPAPVTPARGSSSRGTPGAPSSGVPPSASRSGTRRQLGAQRDFPCLGCVRSLLAGSSDGRCFDNALGRGARCYRCASGHACKEVPANARSIVGKLYREIAEKTSTKAVSFPHFLDSGACN
jgi:hypothetical protein